jgi:hypothetical protein
MTFLQRLVGELCSHRFAWPRLSDSGQHYQVCVVCGNAYEYDWKAMHRTDRLLVIGGEKSSLGLGGNQSSQGMKLPH